MQKSIATILELDYSEKMRPPTYQYRLEEKDQSKIYFIYVKTIKRKTTSLTPAGALK